MKNQKILRHQNQGKSKKNQRKIRRNQRKIRKNQRKIRNQKNQTFDGQKSEIRASKKYFERATSLQKIDGSKSRLFEFTMKCREKLCLFFAHMIRKSGQVLESVDLAPYSYNIARNNREKPRTNSFERTKTWQKIDENPNFFRSRQKLCLFVTNCGARVSNKRASAGAC